MKSSFDILGREVEAYPPYRQLGELARYMIAYYDDTQPLSGDGSADGQSDESEPDTELITARPDAKLTVGSEPSGSTSERLVNTEDFDAIFVRYRDKIHGFIQHMVHDTEAAQDLTQDAFIRAYVALAKPVPVPEARLQAWLYRIAYNISIDYLRRGSLIGFEPLPPIAAESGGPGAEILVSKEPPFDEQLANMEVMHQTLQRLKPSDAAVIVLDALYGLNRDEIATIIGAKPSGMHMRMSRAHARARKIADELSQSKDVAE